MGCVQFMKGTFVQSPALEAVLQIHVHAEEAQREGEWLNSLSRVANKGSQCMYLATPGGSMGRTWTPAAP